MNEEFQMVKLSEIAMNPLNPRKSFEGKKFDELVKSIKEKGVIEPVLLRKQNGGYQLVAGERRFRGCMKAADDSEWQEYGTIPAIIRDLSDDDAFDIMMIENLMRDDLTELEEAESFKNYIDRKGNGAIEQISERTGINVQYIRKRIALLGLPKKVLNYWDKGKLKYSHLEQLIKLEDDKQIEDLAKKAAEYQMPATRLAHDIGVDAIELEKAKFDIKKVGCLSCKSNEQVQKKEMGVDAGRKPRCMNKKCFKKNMNDFLNGNFKKAYRTGTNGFRFYEDVGDQYSGRSKYKVFDSWKPQKPGEKCKKCDKYLSVIRVDGQVYKAKTCFGDKDCFEKMRPKSKKKKEKDQKEKTGPRVPWHGEHFREEFFKSALPKKIGQAKSDSDKILQLILFSMIDAQPELKGWIHKKHKIDDDEFESLSGEVDDGKPYWGNTYLAREKIIKKIRTMKTKELYENLHEASTLILMREATPDCRRLFAEHFGIDLKRDWRITEKYLEKKTIGEMMEIGEKHGIFSDRKAQTFLYEVLNKKRGKFSSCKKAELIRVFLESGVDLAGKVPEEILAD